MTILLAIAALVGAPSLAGLTYQSVGNLRDRRRVPPPGRMVGTLHALVTGEGPVTVLLEAGIAATSVSWQLVQPELSRHARVISYDRAGLGWSRAAATPRTIANTLADLRALLDELAPTGPIVLVGHSFGGLAVLEYAHAYPDRIAGLVLVDPLPASEWHPIAPHEAVRLSHGVRLSRRGATLARFGFVRVSLDLLRAGSRTIPQLAAKASAGRGSALTERLVGQVRKLPRELWPAVQSHWCQPKSFLSMASHLENLPESAAACTDHSASLGAIPVIVLSAADSSPSRSLEHDAMAARSSKGIKRIAEKSGHWIQLDEPDRVTASIVSLLGDS